MQECCIRFIMFYQFNQIWLNKLVTIFMRTRHCLKIVQIRRFSGPYFPVFRLNTEIYSVNLRIHPKYRKMRIRRNSVFGHFSRSEFQTTNDKMSFGLKRKNSCKLSTMCSLKVLNCAIFTKLRKPVRQLDK